MNRLFIFNIDRVISFLRLRSKYFLPDFSLIALPFHRELKLINYQDLSQDTLFIRLDPSIMKGTHNGRMMLILENTAYATT